MLNRKGNTLESSSRSCWIFKEIFHAEGYTIRDLICAKSRGYLRIVDHIWAQTSLNKLPYILIWARELLKVFTMSVLRIVWNLFRNGNWTVWNKWYYQELAHTFSQALLAITTVVQNIWHFLYCKRYFGNFNFIAITKTKFSWHFTKF